MNFKKLGSNKYKSAFTLAELLVVVAIVGILVAISIPVFTSQRKKAIIATNKANIRAAKAAAIAAMYDDEASLDKASSSTKGAVSYFVYDVKSGSIVTTISSGNYNPTVTYAEKSWTMNELGRQMRSDASAYKICEVVLVYVGNNADDGALIQTAPYYTDDDELGFAKNNPFGPGNGSANAS